MPVVLTSFGRARDEKVPVVRVFETWYVLYLTLFPSPLLTSPSKTLSHSESFLSQFIVTTPNLISSPVSSPLCEARIPLVSPFIHAQCCFQISKPPPNLDIDPYATQTTQT